MTLNLRKLLAAGAAPVALAGALLFSGSAAALPVGWNCVGTCGSLGANGVVTTSPQGGSYSYVTTSGGQTIAGLGLGSETTGSVARSNAFTVNAGEDLQFYFNYVTSDGAGYADYAWVRLLDSALNPYAILFTARTTPEGDTVPGFGMPDLGDVTLDPGSTPIIAGAPQWSPLGGDSASCYDDGCGYTDWIAMSYEFDISGTFSLEFGVVNWSDSLFQSGLAFDGILVAGNPIDPQPVSAPGTLALFGLTLLGMAGMRRRREV